MANWSVRPALRFTFSLVLGLGLIGVVHPVLAQIEATSETKSVAVIPPGERPDLRVESEYVSSTGSDTLEAGETGNLEITVLNQGGGPAQSLDVSVSPRLGSQEISLVDSLTSNDEGWMLIGEVPSLGPSTTKTFSVTLRAGTSLTGDPVQFRIEVEEKNDFGLDEPHTLTVPTERFVKPALTVSGFDVEGVQEQKLQPDTASTVRIQVENTGEGAARALQAKVEVEENGRLLASAGTAQELGTVPSGSTTELAVNLQPSADAESVPLRISLRSAEDPYQTTDRLTLPVAAPDRPPLVDRDIPAGDTTRDDAVAVVIGTRNYRNPEVPNVDYAERDAKTVKKYLTKTMGFREGNVLELINPTQAELAAVFGTAQTHKGRLYDFLRTDSTEVFVFYSGHGAPNPEEDGRTYFLPSNGSPQQLAITGYPVHQMYENLAKMTSGPVTVAIDACFSGQSEGGALVRNASPALLSVENPMVGMENGMVMTASKADQISSWYPEKKHGLFTYFLLKGLRGEADENQDGRVTGAEMKQYLGENVSYYARRLHSRTQNPQVMGKGSDRVLVRFETADANGSDAGGQESGSDPDAGESLMRDDRSGGK